MNFNFIFQYSEEALEALRTDIGVMFCDNKIKDLHDNTEINEKLMMLGNLIHTIKRTHDEQMNAASVCIVIIMFTARCFIYY